MRIGLIPAGAGKTFVNGSGCPPYEAHPRGGGENRLARLVLGAPMWLIPAGAGKTSPWKSRASQPSAHPRGGGENSRARFSGLDDRGSSPRGRGKQVEKKPETPSQGLIPAWAGKTRLRSSCRRRIAAHPRVGGENHAR